MVTETSFEEALEQIEKWVENHKTLPIIIEPILLRRYIHSVHNDVEQTKKLIEHSYNIRDKYHKIFKNRDPLHEDVQNMFKVADLGISMPSLTKSNQRIIINRLVDYDAEKFNFDMIIRTFFMAADLRFSLPDEDLPLKVNDGDIPVFDMSGFSYRHLTKLSLSTLRCYMKFTQEAFPVRLKQIHLINVSPVLNKILLILKPFMKTSVSELLNFHLPSSSSFYEHVPIELLPDEYGGKAGRMQDIKENFIMRLESKRDYFLSDAHWKRRDSNNKPSCSEKVELNFKSLSFD